MKIMIVGPATVYSLRDLLFTPESEIPEGMGGTPVNALVRSLHNLGHELVLVTCSSAVSETRTLHGPRLSVEIVPYRSRARDRAKDLFREERLQLRRSIRRHEVDVVNAHWTYEFAWASFGANAPVVVTAHDSPPDILRHQFDAYRFIRLLMAIRVRFGIRNLTAVAPYLATRWRVLMAYYREVRVIPNISPYSLTDSANVNETDRLDILDIADSSDRKNVRTLLRAFALVRTDLPTATLTLVGSGLDDSEALASWALKSGLSANVHFRGILDRTQLAMELKRSTQFVHPSREEAQPMCLLEAIAFGIPIVAGRESGGVPWTLDDGRAGVLTDVDDAQALADAILKVHRDADAAEERVQYARDLLLSKFSSEVVGLAYYNSYLKVLQERRGSAHRSRPSAERRS